MEGKVLEIVTGSRPRRVRRRLKGEQGIKEVQAFGDRLLRGGGRKQKRGCAGVEQALGLQGYRPGMQSGGG